MSDSQPCLLRFPNIIRRSSTQVSLKAREVLIACQMPSYEERKAQMEGILRASVTHSYYGEQGSDMKYVTTTLSIIYGQLTLP